MYIYCRVKQATRSSGTPVGETDGTDETGTRIGMDRLPKDRPFLAPPSRIPDPIEGTIFPFAHPRPLVY